METQTSFDRYYSRLTPSAREFIAGIDTTFQEPILNEALYLARKKRTITEKVSVVDVLNIANTFINSGRAENKKNRLTWLIAVGAVIYGIAGILIYLVQHHFFLVDTGFICITSVTGIGVVWLAYDYLQIKILKKKQTLSCKGYAEILQFNEEYELLMRWKIIEQETAEIMWQNENMNSYQGSVAQVISYLVNIIAENETESNRIRELLHTRNRIVYEQYILTPIERQQHLQFANELIQKLENMVRTT